MKISRIRMETRPRAHLERRPSLPQGVVVKRVAYRAIIESRNVVAHESRRRNDFLPLRNGDPERVEERS